MFGFGSCGSGSWSISVQFGSVFGTFCIDNCFFSGIGKANTDCFPQEVYCFPQEVSWAAAFKERRELNSENQSFLKLSVHAIYYEETHICFFHWTQKAVTAFPISLLGEGKTVPVPPVRFCTCFQRFTVPTVHRLFDFLQFGSKVPVRFPNPIAFLRVKSQFMLVNSCKIPDFCWKIFQCPGSRGFVGAERFLNALGAVHHGAAGGAWHAGPGEVYREIRHLAQEDPLGDGTGLMNP